MQRDENLWMPSLAYIAVGVIAVVATYMLIDSLPPVGSFLPGSFSRLG